MHHEVRPPTAHGWSTPASMAGASTAPKSLGKVKADSCSPSRCAPPAWASRNCCRPCSKSARPRVRSKPPLQRRQGVGGGHPGDLGRRPQGHGQGPGGNVAQAPGRAEGRASCRAPRAQSAVSLYSSITAAHAASSRAMSAARSWGEAASAASMRRSNSARSSGRATTAAISVARRVRIAGGTFGCNVEALPGGHFHGGPARLGHRRHLGQRGIALRRQRGQDAQGARLGLRFATAPTART